MLAIDGHPDHGDRSAVGRELRVRQPDEVEQVEIGDCARRARAWCLVPRCLVRYLCASCLVPRAVAVITSIATITASIPTDLRISISCRRPGAAAHGIIERMSVLDLLIVGAGPSGLATAISARKAGLSCEIVEKGVLVNSIFHFPVNMVFFTTPELLEIGGVPLVTPFEKPTRLEALRYYRRVAEMFDLPIAFGETVAQPDDRRRDVGDLVVRTRRHERRAGAPSPRRGLCGRLLRPSQSPEHSGRGPAARVALLQRGALLITGSAS